MATLLIAFCVKQNQAFLIVPAAILGFGLDIVIAFGIAQALK